MTLSLWQITDRGAGFSRASPIPVHENAANQHCLPYAYSY